MQLLLHVTDAYRKLLPTDRCVSLNRQYDKNVIKGPYYESMLLSEHVSLEIVRKLNQED